MSKYKNIFAKICVPNWSEEVFAIKNVKNFVLWTYVVNDLRSEKWNVLQKGIAENKSKIV